MTDIEAELIEQLARKEQQIAVLQGMVSEKKTREAIVATHYMEETYALREAKEVLEKAIKELETKNQVCEVVIDRPGPRWWWVGLTVAASSGIIVAAVALVEKFT